MHAQLYASNRGLVCLNHALGDFLKNISTRMPIMSSLAVDDPSQPSAEQPGLRTRIAAMIIAAMAIGIVVLCLLYRAHTDMRVPIAYHGDSLYHVSVFKGIGEGNLPWKNARLAAPFSGSDWRDFPGYQWVDFVAFKFLSLFAHDYIRAFNCYWILTILATAATAAYSFVRLRISPAVACCLAILYAGQPFIFVRNITHFVLLAYMVPLLATVCLEVALGRWEGTQKKYPLDIPPYAWLTFLLQGVSFFYFSFFGALLLLTAAFVGGCARRTLRPFVYTACLTVVLALASIVGVSPTLMHWSRDGSNPIATARTAADAELNGLKIRHMLTPVPDHPIPFVRRLALKAAAAHPEITESVGTRLGLFAAIGFIGLILYILAVISGWTLASDDGTVRACAALLLVALLWCTVGGFGSVISTFVTTLIRGYDRVIVFIVFFILASYGTIATSFFSKTKWITRNFKIATLVVITAASFADALWFVPQTPEMRQHAYTERTFVSNLETVLGKNAAVFEIPYTAFPSGAGPGRIAPFDHLRPYIQSNGLKWSFGTTNGRPEASWEQDVSQFPPEVMIQELVRKGFRGLWIDTYGYQDAAMVPSKAISTVLTRQPMSSSDGRYLVFDLAGVRLSDVSTIQDSLPSPYEGRILNFGKCNVDAVDWNGIAGPSVPVSRLARLRLDGWVADVDKGVAQPDVYVEISTASNRRFYIHASRSARPDVAAAFRQPSLMQSGFVASAKVTNLPPGLYDIRILQLAPDTIEACNSGIKLDVQ